MSNLDACAAHEAVTEARLRRLINERFGSDTPMGVDHLSMIDDIDVRIQQMQRHMRLASAQIAELSDLLSQS